MRQKANLESFRILMGYHPFHFWGLSSSSVYPVSSKCNTVIFEHAWQNDDASGRAEVKTSIDTALRRISDYVEFGIEPVYRTDSIKFPPSYSLRGTRLGFHDGISDYITVALPYGKLLEIGQERLVLLGTYDVTYTDVNTDGAPEHYSVTIPIEDIGDYDISQTELHFITDDLVISGDSQPVASQTSKVSSDGTNVTISGGAWTCVPPRLYEFSSSMLDPTDMSNFAEQFRLYARTVDTENQGYFTWGYSPYTEGTSSEIGYDPYGSTTYNARVSVRSNEYGIVAPIPSTKVDGNWVAVHNSASPPEYVTINYVSGYVGGDGKDDFTDIILMMAAAELGIPPSLCDGVNQRLYHFQKDLARADKTERFTIAPEDLKNPFGTRNGHVEAWRRVRYHRLIRGLSNI